MKSSPRGRPQFKPIHGPARIVAAEPASSSQIIDRLLTALRKAIVNFAASYRPEKHYMRGPGPRCSSKENSAERVKEDALPIGRLLFRLVLAGAVVVAASCAS